MIAITTFGQWLKQRRKALDLTQEELAQRIGCAANTLYKIEADERRPSKQVAALLAELLNIPPDERPAFVRFARAEAVADSAPWGTPFHPPTNLPTQPTVLIGREEDVTAIRKRLLQSEVRLLTLTGPPGIGKTRLALQVAAEVLDDFTNGVFFVALAPISDANLVATSIASTLGITEGGPRTPLERLKAFLRDKQMLLVLDNFEQILSAAPDIAELLAACPWLKLLATSRSPLRIRQERQMPVSPLAVPDLAHLPDVESMAHYSAVTLFMERAQAVQPDFSINTENAPTVAAICARLDGLPLAIELISARIKILSPVALLKRLGGPLMLQSDGLRDVEARHRTLNAAISWSYQLLSADEQTLFRRLGIFVGGWTLEAAGAVCLENLRLNLLDGMASLLDKNLVKQNMRSEGEPRFMMLETIREYALEQLAASGELDDLRHRHVVYFLKLAEVVAPESIGGAQQGQGWDDLEAEHTNLRAALTWSRREASGETKLRLAVALSDFWSHRGHLSEGSGWLTESLAQSEGGEPSTTHYRTLRAKALAALAVMNHWQGNPDAAQPRHEECVALFRELGHRAALAEALGTYGMLFVLRGDFELARPLMEEMLALARELGNDGLIALSYNFLGNLAYSQGYIQQAGAHWEEALALFRLQTHNWIISVVLSQLAMTALDERDYHRALSHLVESLTRFRELGERWQAIYTLEVFAFQAVVQGEQSEDAKPRFLRAARLFGVAEALRETYSAPILPFQRRPYEQGVTALRAQLDEAMLVASWEAGRKMTLDQAVEYALSE
ncbi:MAG: tetratricopeptide repeat protein [Burkholderiales bacterium]|nr:tetratricopeptide repeat protein [Anaerolineae bacterium]